MKVKVTKIKGDVLVRLHHDEAESIVDSLYEALTPEGVQFEPAVYDLLSELDWATS